MKVIQLSDIHIHNEKIVECDPVVNFDAAMKHIGKHHKDADMIVISGDLTHCGTTETYKMLKDMLEECPMQPHLIIGNHDNRTNFQNVFSNTPKDENNFVQYVVDTKLGQFVFLDTHEIGTHCGKLCDKRLDWLQEKLKGAKEKNKKIFLVMHHHPTDIGVPNTDEIGLVEENRFHNILDKFSDTIRHIFFGHAHFILSGSIGSIPFSAPRSTSHPSVPEFYDPTICLYGGIQPTYNVCLIGEKSVVIHSIEFLIDDQIKAYTEQDDRD